MSESTKPAERRRTSGVTYTRADASYFEKRGLRRHAGAWSLWALGVAAVISGDFSGWNLGIGEAGWGGMLVATVVIGLMYLLMVYSIAEMSAAMPHTGGAYSFGRSAMGPWGGFVTGLLLVFLPAVAPRSFLRDFRGDAAGTAGRDVLLWPDTFNNHFHPDAAHAAVRVLQHAGFRVRVPAQPVCCGRPLYEFGLLDDARKYLEHVLAVLDEDLKRGTPVVVLEPACLSVFKEELPLMLPKHEQAKRLTMQSVLLADFLQQHAPGAEFIALDEPALVHGHCHHKSVLGFDGELSLLRDRLHLDLDVPDTGCCGMAGSFGFEAEKYQVAQACGERVLLPAVRQADAGKLIIADGYSCREQIAQSTGRTAVHVAQVLERAIPR